MEESRDPFHQDLKSRVRILSGELAEKSNYPKEVLPSVIRNLFDYLPYHRMRNDATPLFEMALKDQTTTAWVFDNDKLALAASHFLSERRIQVPEQISLIGFDNSRQATIANITSFDFGLSRMAQKAFDFFSSPDSLKSGGIHKIKLKGRIVRRSSTK